MNRPISLKINATLHDEALALLKADKVKYRSFTAMVEQALSQFIANEKQKGYEDKK